MSNNAPDYKNNLAFDPDINTMPRCDIEALKSEIKHLKDLQNAQDKRVEELEQVLSTLHEFDPAGIGARSLQECLLLQILTQG